MIGVKMPSYLQYVYGVFKKAVCDFLPLHCKRSFSIFPSPAGRSLTKLSLDGNNLIIPGQGEFGK
jgi:hypothetical protein